MRPSVLNTLLASSDWMGAEYKSAHETAAKEAIYRRLHAAVAVHGIQVGQDVGVSCSPHHALPARTRLTIAQPGARLRLMTRLRIGWCGYISCLLLVLMQYEQVLDAHSTRPT